MGHEKFVGHILFDEGKIAVTDPCYDKSTDCQLALDIAPGLYKCYASEDSTGCIEYSYIMHENPSEYISRCIHPDYLWYNWKDAGTICVDAGLAGYFQNKPDYDRIEWIKFCNAVHDGNAWIFKNKTHGFLTSSGCGDGEYPVQVLKENNEIVAVRIRF
jgi:hypothetical protein